MKNLILIITAAILCVGCSKGGSKSRVMDGGSMEDIVRTPTDTNMPEPQGVTPKN